MAQGESREALKILYREYRQLAAKCFASHYCAQRQSDKKLDDSQKSRLRIWFEIRKSLNGAHQKHFPKTISELKNHIGSGVWRVDYTQECYRYESLASKFLTPNEAKAACRRIRIPFNQGTIGRIVRDSAQIVKGGEGFIARNSVGDLFGQATLGDQMVGHINVLLVPIITPGTLGQVQLILSLFLPVPDVFGRPFAKEFVRDVNPIGQQILMQWERDAYEQVTDAIRGNNREQRDDDFYKNLDQLGESIGAPPQKLRSDRDPFPLVAVLRTEPIAEPLETRPPPVSIWVEPASFFYHWQKADQHALIANKAAITAGKNWIAADLKEVDCVLGPIDNMTQPICPLRGLPFTADLVVPLISANQLQSQIRVHISLPLLRSETLYDASTVSKVAAKLNENQLFRLLITHVGDLICALRHAIKPDSIAYKIAWELEWELVQATLAVVSHQNAKSNEPRTVANLFEIIAPRILDIKQWPSIRKNFDFLRDNFPFIDVGSQSHVREAFIGYSYWTWRPQLVPSRELQPNDVKDDLREFQSALTLMAISASLVAKSESGDFAVAKKGNRWKKMARSTAAPGPVTFACPPHSIPRLSGHHGALKLGWLKKGSNFWVTVDGRREWKLSPRSPSIGGTYAIGSSPDEPNRIGQHLEVLHGGDLTNPVRLKAMERAFSDYGRLTGFSKKQLKFSTLAKPQKIEAPKSVQARATKLFTDLLGADALGIQSIQFFPAQVLDHIYGWLVTGSRHPTNAPNSRANLLQQNAVDYIDQALSRICGDTERQLVYTTYSTAYEQTDILHVVKRPAIMIHQVLAELCETGLSSPKSRPWTLEDWRKLRSAANRAILLRDWAAFWKDADKDRGSEEREDNSLYSLLDKALNLANGRLREDSDKERHHAACEAIRERLKHSLPNRIAISRAIDSDKRWLVTLLFADVFLNAVEASEYDQSVVVLWHPRRAAFEISNSVAKPAQNTIDRLSSALNQSLSFDRERRDELVAQFSSRGIRNILTWACRCRIGLECRFNKREKIFTFTTHMGHLLTESLGSQI